MELFKAPTARAKKFRQHIRQYNAAFAFTSLNYTTDKRTDNRQGIQSFSIHGELYHLQGPLSALPGQDSQFAQLYFYNPAYATEVCHRRHVDLDPTVLQQLSNILQTINPFIQLYKTAKDRIEEDTVDGSPTHVILNPQMRLMIEKGAD